MKFKRLLAMLLSTAMVFSFAATGALAAETDGSELEPITKGSFRDENAAPRYATAQNENVDGKKIVDDVSWHNGVIYDEDGEWSISDTTITMDTDADGSDTNDFSGLGAAVMNNGSYVEITDSEIETTGVAKLALFTDNGGVTVVKNTSMSANGGVIYDGYLSTADQSLMVSPPWVLGLGGNVEEPCNARTTNLMGDYSVAAYVDSYFYAKGWGALSVDSGTNMNMVVVNTEVDVETSGYGAYNIGNSTESYYGSTMDVSTYAIIMTGGEASFQSYTGGQEIDVVQFSGETNEYSHGINGTTVATVSSDKVAEGETVISKIVSDNFGFMCHNNGGSGWNVLKILDGTEVTTGDAIFLIKKVEADITVDNAVLESGNNVIVQIIDNDDDYVGLDFAAEWGEDNGFGHSFGSHMPTFNSTFTEAEGYSNEWIADTAAAGKADYDTTSNWTVNYTMTNTAAEGDLWNSTGYVGGNVASTMNVNLGEGAALTGVISAGAFSHTTKYAEVGDGDWTAASALGHVTNIPCFNGVNLVNVTLTDDASWVVTGDSIVTSLTAASTAITAEEAVTITVKGTLTLDGEAVVGTKTVGSVTYVVNPFTDVNEGDYYHAAALWAVENGITNGTNVAGTTFSPDDDCTRSQAVTFLWRAYDKPAAAAADFTDVEAGSYYADAVAWAVENAVTNGTNTEGTTFSPDLNCTRGQIVTFLWRAAGCPEPTTTENPFTDVDENAYYYNAVLWAVENGITNGTNTAGTTFSPNLNCTRGQIVTFLYRALAE